MFLGLYAFDVFAGTRIDLYDVAFVDKNRSLKLATCFDFNRLANIR